MPKIEITDEHLIIRLNPIEKLAALHGDVWVNLTAVSSAFVADQKWWKTIGFRIGTGLPGIVIAGTFIKHGDRAFVSWVRKSGLPLEIKLSTSMEPDARGTNYTRILVGVEDAQELANKLTRRVPVK